MTKPKEPTMVTNMLIQMLLPALVFISTAAVMYSQVADLKVITRTMSNSVQSISERLIKVETKVQFLYDERKEGK